jgi:hypothetical protein
MKKKISAILAFVFCAGLASAQQPAVMVSTTPGWHKIATTTVDFTKERDEVSVLGADHFSAIKLSVSGAPIDLQDLEIYYENGAKQDVAIRTPLEIGRETRVINVEGGDRDIDKIVLVYKTMPNRKDEKAEVTILGLKPGATADADNNKDYNHSDVDHHVNGDVHTDMGHNHVDADVHTNNGQNHTDADRDHATASQNKNSDMGKPIPSPKIEVNDKTGWHKIGETIVSFAKERDEIAVLGSDRYAKLKFKATDAGIMISDITISYEDGTKQDVPVAATMAMGVESRVIDVPGAEKDIARISFVYKTIPNQAKDKAHLEIWGYKTNADKSTGMK